MAQSHGRLKGYLLGRSAVLFGLLPLVAVYMARHELAGHVSFRWFFIATGASFLVTFLSLVKLWLRPDSVSKRLSVQPYWDVIYATCLVYFSGGGFSPFVFLYILTIIGTAILSFRRGSLMVATLCAILYGVLVDLQFYGVIEPVNPFPFVVFQHWNLVVQLILNVTAFYVIALLAGYLAEEARTSRRRLAEARDEILNLEHLQGSVLSSLTSGIVALDNRGIELFHNRSAEELLKAVGAELEPGRSLPEVLELEEGERKEFTTPDGAVVLGYSLSPLWSRKGKRIGSIVIFQDLTKIRHLEDGLRRADRLAAVGRLAAGLAHEIRNPLASLSGSAQILADRKVEDSQERMLAAIVARETDRLNQLVTDFLNYARPGKTVRNEFALREFVDEMGYFFKHGEGKEGFVLKNDVAEGTTLNADRKQMEQVFLNLFRNSKEAASGEVSIRVTGNNGDGSVWFDVADDGPGIPMEKAGRIFEPFFSSKEGGVGLGLASVHSIAENHGGNVTLESAPEGGAVFKFKFTEEDDG